MSTATVPSHIAMTRRGNLICERCGRGISLQGTWPKGREAKRRAFIETHRDCGTTTTAREGEE